MIIENLTGVAYESLTNSRRKVKYRDCYEIYVQNVDRVVIVPPEIADFINSLEDLESIEFVDGVGVCVCGEPLRVLGDKIGIAKDDFDLRECR